MQMLSLKKVSVSKRRSSRWRMTCGITKQHGNNNKPEYLCSGFFIPKLMVNLDYVVVGGGYAGLFFAHQLIKNKKSFVIFTGDRKSASRISAGIVNPVVLKKFTTFWLAKEQIEALHRTLSEISGYTGENYLIPENIQRLFHDENEKDLWLQKSESAELKPYLNP